MSACDTDIDWLQKSFASSAEFFAADARMQQFQNQQRKKMAARGLPTQKEEAWKYTDVNFLKKKNFLKPTSKTLLQNKIADKRLKIGDSILLVFVNGFFAGEYSDLNLIKDQIVICNLKTAYAKHSEKLDEFLFTHRDEKKFPFAVLNHAFMTDGVFLYVARNVQMNIPIHILFLTTEKEILTCPRNVIVVAENAEAVILEEHVSMAGENYFTNVVTDIHAAKNAKVFYHKIQNEAQTATHISQLFIHQQRDSVVESYSLSLGARLNREDVWANLDEQHAACKVNGFYYLSQHQQHTDHHAQINHLVPHGTSHMLYKGVIDVKAKAVFNGKIYVYPNAQKTLSQQANHNLMLSKEAEVFTKPEFEIYADDVKCSHADTVGQLDQNALFFLRSRGINKDEAIKILTQAFAADVFNTIKNTAILKHMNQFSEMFQHE